MPNNIAVSVTADIADLQVKRAIMSAELKAASKDLSDFAKQANASGLTDELRTGMLAAGDAVARTKNQIAGLDAELKDLRSTEDISVSAGQRYIAALREQVETQGMSRKELAAYRAEKLGVTAEAQPFIEALKSETGHAISSRASFESLVLVHEALQGRTSRMAGSAMILGQALAGQEATTAALNAVMTPLGIAIAGVAAAAITAEVATVQYEAAQRALLATSVGVGAASEITVEQMNRAGEAAASWGQRSVSSTTEAASAFAAAGIRSEATIKELSSSVEVYAALTGQTAADALKELAAATQDPIKGSKDLNEQLHILDSTQMEQIRTLAEAGDKTGAVTILTKALADREKDATDAGLKASGTFGTLKTDLSDLWTWLGKVNDSLSDMNNLWQTLGLMESNESIRAREADTEFKLQRHARLLADSAAGAAALAGTPEGKDASRKADLVSNLAAIKTALAADTELHGANSEEVKKDRKALDDYTNAIRTFLPEAEKAHRIATLQDQLAVARRSHNKGLIDDLSKQIELTKLSGQVMSASEANTRAADAGRTAGDRAGAGRKAKGPSIVSEWQEQLHAAEIASGDFFSDQTKRELDFWQSKVGLTKQGSKEWLEVQSKIYEAQKTLARQGYEQHLADLNDQIEADHDNWKAVQKDWEEKLAFIKSKFGEQSREYLDAHREFQRLERQHQDQMDRLQEEGAKKALEALKKSLDAARQVREADAKSTEAVIRSESGGSPFGDISAETKIAELHQQLIQQQIADLDRLDAAERDHLQKTLDDARSTYGEISQQFINAQQAMTDAMAAQTQARAALENKAKETSITDILAVKQAYHGYIDGVLGSTVSGLTGIIGRTQTWQQAVSGIYNSLLNTIDQVLTRMVTNWVIKHVFMTAAQRAQLAAQTAAHIGSEATKTAATLGGNAVRTAATAVSTGTAVVLKTHETIHHVGSEEIKTAATITGTVARTAATISGAEASSAVVGAMNSREIVNDAKLAASGAYKAVAGIPVVGPILAPIAAATAFAGVMAFDTLASFDVGTNEVPRDMVAKIHAGERIIPAADNRRLMEALNDNDRAPSRMAAGGDTINHHRWEYHDHTDRGLREDEIIANRAAFAKAMKMAWREGKLGFAPPR